MLEIETYMKSFSENKIEEKPNTKPNNYGRSEGDVLWTNKKDNCWFCSKRCQKWYQDRKTSC